MRCKTITVLLLIGYLLFSFVRVYPASAVEYSDVFIEVEGSGITNPVVGEYLNYTVGSSLTVYAYPTLGYEYIRMERNGANYTSSNPATFNDLDVVEVITVVFVLLPTEWHDVETWNFTGFGFTQGMAWPADTAIYLSAYNTYVDFNETAYFDSFEWSPTYSSVAFVNVKMGYGQPVVPNLVTSIVLGNITFSTIDYQHQIGFEIYALAATQPILYLSGIGSKPSYVTVEGSLAAEGVYWNYVSDTITITYPFAYTGGSSVELYWGVLPSGWHTVEVWTVLPYTGTLPSVEVYNQYYFKNDVHTVNTVTGYNMQLESGQTLTYAQENLGVSNETVYFGFKAFMVNSSGVEISITGADPIATMARTVAGEGYQIGITSVPSLPMNLGYESIKVELYVKLESRTWLLAATYTTDRLLFKGLIASNWGFEMYTKTEVELDGDVLATAYWGSQANKSSVSGLHFITPLPQEIAIWRMSLGDWVGGILYPFMIIIGDAVYGLILLYVGGTLYLRHKKWEVILAMVLMFGGVGGVGFLIPSIAYRLVYLVLVFIIAIVLYRVFR